MPSDSCQATVDSIPSVDRRQLGADVGEDERARAVGVLGHARREAGLAEQRALLVADDAAHRRARRRAGAADGHAEAAARRAHLGQRARAGRPGARPARRPRPRWPGRGASCGWRCDGSVTSACAAGEVPDDPAVDRAQRQVGAGRHAALGEQPGHLGGREVRVEHEAGAPAHEREVAGCGEGGATVGGAPVLPHDGPVEGPAGAAVPGHHRLALVGDADGRRPVRRAWRTARRASSAPPARSRRRRARPTPAGGSAG